MSEEINKSLDKLNISKEDIIIFRGEWEVEEVQSLAKYFQDRKMQNIMVVIPDEKSLETMPEEEFYFLLKGIEKSRKGEEDAIQTES